MKKNWAVWAPKANELVLKYTCIKEYTKCQFKSVDFEGEDGRESPRDNPTNLKEGYLFTLLKNLSRKVTLYPSKQALSFHNVCI